MDMEQKPDGFEERRVLDAALKEGHILLQNGDESSRVEETMERICRQYSIMSDEFSVLSNGIFPSVAICWTAYYLMISQLGDALSNGFLALKVMLAIVLGIIFVFEIPHQFFHIIDRRKWPSR